MGYAMNPEQLSHLSQSDTDKFTFIGHGVDWLRRDWCGQCSRRKIRS